MNRSSFLTSYSNLSRLETTDYGFGFIDALAEQIEKVYRPPEEFVRIKHEMASSSREVMQALAGLQEQVDNLPTAIQSRCLARKEELKELQEEDEHLSYEIEASQTELVHVKREVDVVTTKHEDLKTLAQLVEDIHNNYELASNTASSNLQIVSELDR